MLEDDGDASRANRHGPLLPNSVRDVICGPSGCGKNECAFKYARESERFAFRERVRVLEIVASAKVSLSRAGVVADRRNRILYVLGRTEHAIREYFSMGRHSNVDCFYLCQSYARIPKHLIRDNANFLMLFKQDGTNLRRVYNDHVNTDMTFESFNDLCARCWRRRYDFVVIDKDSSMYEGRYRRGFNEFVVARGYK